MSEHTRTYGDCTITLLPGWRFYVKELDKRYDSVREAEAAIDRAEANLSASSEPTLVDRLRRSMDTAVCCEAADEIERLQQFKTMFNHALDCVDAVFQIDNTKPPPLLPEFCRLGDDKFKAIIRLAEEFKRMALTWSGEPPTEPGWYWYRYVIGNFDNTCVVLVVQPERGGPYVKFHSGRSELLRDISSCVQWARVTEPQERPE